MLRTKCPLVARCRRSGRVFYIRSVNQVQAAFRELSASLDSASKVGFMVLGCSYHLATEVLAHISGSLADRAGFAKSDRLGSGPCKVLFLSLCMLLLRESQVQHFPAREL